MNRFNGDFGCHACYVNGAKVKRTNANSREVTLRCYPYTGQDTELRERTSWLKDIELIKDAAHYKGIKLRSEWLALPYFDPRKSVPVDIMHALFEGVTKYIISTLVNSLANDKLNIMDSML